MEKICWQITVAAFMQPLQYDLRSPAAKDNSITNAATARSNLDAAITMRSAETELQNTIELRATASEIVAPTPCVDRTCTKHRWNPIYNAKPIRPIRAWSDHDPSMIRPHTRLCMEKHRVSCICYQNIGFRASARHLHEHDPVAPQTGRSSRFGDGLCMEKHRVSCICYLSKTHFVRDFLQNSIGNSSTSTTCNAICIAGTILQLQITMEFHRQLIHQHHLQSHLHCGNDPTVANHNGILSTAHARNTGETPFTMRNRSEHDPPMIRTWSDHTRDRLAPVAPQR